MLEAKVLPAGDSALVVDFGNVIDEKINDKVHALAAALEAKKTNGIIEMVPTFRSLMVCFDVQKTCFAALRDIIVNLEIDALAGLAERRVWQIPCCYEGGFAPDLGGMSELLGISEAEIIKIHSGTDYKIYMLGFLPGFVYLGGMDERIAAPRLKTPRLKIPCGAVAIGGSQTGVYPMESPGGWRIIGSTPVDFYNPQRKKPILCEAGEYIRFVPVTAEEYQALKLQTDYLPECRIEKGGAL